MVLWYSEYLHSAKRWYCAIWNIFFPRTDGIVVFGMVSFREEMSLWYSEYLHSYQIHRRDGIGIGIQIYLWSRYRYRDRYRQCLIRHCYEIRILDDMNTLFPYSATMNQQNQFKFLYTVNYMLCLGANYCTQLQTHF